MSKSISKSLPTVLVSACLLGEPCRYDGKALQKSRRNSLAILDDKVVWIPFCPEQEGGLPTPRPAACLVGGTGAEVLDGGAEVRTLAGFNDVTSFFRRGAELALKKAEDKECRFAVLKSRSPSCGRGQVYHRTSKEGEQELIPGDGVAAALLLRNGFEVFSEENWLEAEEQVVALLKKNKSTTVAVDLVSSRLPQKDAT